MEVNLDGRHVTYQLKRSLRARWARLEIQLHRGIRVILPLHAPESDAEKLIRSKSTWLLRNLKRFDRLRGIVPDRSFVSGERLPFLDDTLTLEVIRGLPRVERHDLMLSVSLPRQDRRRVRVALEDWYVAQGEIELARRVEEITKRFGIKIRAVRITRARTRWGSCSSTGLISLNWRLMLAPSTIVDYLIAHELSHVGHRNHSPRFWARVAELHPAYKEAEKWLRKNGVGVVL